MTDHADVLRRLYDRFNARDVEAVLAVLHEDVLWANGMEGGHVRGREAVRDYWSRQWTIIDPSVEPTAFSTRPDGDVVVVDVHQVVRDLQGVVIADRHVGHVFRFENGLVTRFDIRDA